MHQHQLKIKNILEAIKEESCQEEVFNIFHNYCREENITDIALAMFYGAKNPLDSWTIFHSYPKEWVIRYQEQEYFKCDPVYKSLAKISFPFAWHHSSFEDLSLTQQQLMDEAFDFGVKKGFTIPLLPTNYYHGFVTLLNQQTLHPELLYNISLIGNTCNKKIINEQVKKFCVDTIAWGHDDD